MFKLKESPLGGVCCALRSKGCVLCGVGGGGVIGMEFEGACEGAGIV